MSRIQTTACRPVSVGDVDEACQCAGSVAQVGFLDGRWVLALAPCLPDGAVLCACTARPPPDGGHRWTPVPTLTVRLRPPAWPVRPSALQDGLTGSYLRTGLRLGPPRAAMVTQLLISVDVEVALASPKPWWVRGEREAPQMALPVGQVSAALLPSSRPPPAPASPPAPGAGSADALGPGAGAAGS